MNQEGIPPEVRVAIEILSFSHVEGSWVPESLRNQVLTLLSTYMTEVLATRGADVHPPPPRAVPASAVAPPRTP